MSRAILHPMGGWIVAGVAIFVFVFFVLPFTLGPAMYWLEQKLQTSSSKRLGMDLPPPPSVEEQKAGMRRRAMQERDRLQRRYDEAKARGIRMRSLEDRIAKLSWVDRDE